jgi:hypothetical protein
MIGPGKYDRLCTIVREEAGAAGALVLVIDGEKGSGFSVQADIETQMRLPDLLEAMARQIRMDTSDPASFAGQ